MRKLMVGAQVSLDGVMQAPGGPDEDPTKGFQLGGWAAPFRCPERGEELEHLFGQPFDLLLGRKTYENFAGFWPYQSEAPPFGRITKRFNEATKYVVSRSGDIDTSWASSVLLRDLAEVQELKRTAGPTLLTQGSSELVHALLGADLVDAISIFMAPVVLGVGKKLFADGSAPRAFTLVRSRVASNGLFIGHYERGGEVALGGLTDEPSERERARRARMKREG